MVKNGECGISAFCRCLFPCHRTTDTACPLYHGGYTCVVDPVGNITASLPLFTSDALSVSVPIYPYRRTFYAQLKDWLPALFLVIALIATAAYRLSPAFLPKFEADS